MRAEQVPIDKISDQFPEYFASETGRSDCTRHHSVFRAAAKQNSFDVVSKRLN
jgi:hypothetical protein